MGPKNVSPVEVPAAHGIPPDEVTPVASDIEHAAAATNDRFITRLRRGFAFQVIFVPVMLLCVGLLHRDVGTARTLAWAVVYSLFLVWPLVLTFMEGDGPPRHDVRARIGQCNALLLGLLGPLAVNVVSQTDFLALTLLMLIMLVFLGYGYANLPKILHGYLLLLFAPFALCWFFSRYPLGWFMGSTLVLLIIGSFRGAAVARLDTRERLRLQLANENLARRLSAKVDDLDRLNRSKTSLLAAACHDLRQPAHAMGMLIDARVSQEGNGPDRAWLELVQRSNAGLVGMLSTLMDLTRLDSGSMEAERTRVDLRGLLDDARLQFQMAAAQKGLVLRIADSTLTVVSDSYLLRRILFNLLSNAIKYTGEGSISVQVQQQGKTAVLSVADTGIGIPADRQSAVFDEYTRLERSGDGLGIGLSVVKRACSLLDHRLSLTSSPGAGTTVSIAMDLSLLPPDAAQRRPDSHFGALAGIAGAEPDQRRLIAMVEDDAIALRAATILLQSWGYDVMAASQMQVLMDQLAASPRAPVLLVSDLHLQEKDGFEVVRAVRTLPGLANLPALLLTGDLDPTVGTRAREAGIALLHKPAHSRRLRTVINGLLAPTPVG